MADFFVDFSAANDGDGSAANQAASGGASGAYNTLSGKSFSSSDKVWIRRVAGSALGASLTLSSGSVHFIGWPISGDEDYSGRPASGTSNGWDSDGANHPTILFNNNAHSLTLSSAASQFKRIKAQNNASSGTVLTLSGNNNTLTNCQFLHNSTTQGSSTQFNVSGATNKIANTTFEGPQSNSTPYMLTLAAAAAGTQIYNSTVTVNTSFTTKLVGITAVDCYINKLTINVTVATSDADVLVVTTANNRIFDVNVVASVGVTGFTPLKVSGNNNIIHNFSTNSGGASTDGLLFLSGTGNWISFADFTQNPEGTNGLNISGNSNKVMMRNGTYDASTLDVSLGTSPTDNLVMHENVQFSTTIVNTTLHESNKVYSNHHNKTIGAFKQIGKDGEITASSVTRTGGETFSFKFEMLQQGVANRGQLNLGLPGMETVQIALTAGSATLTLYGAHKGYSSTPPKKHTLWFEFQHLDANDKFVHVTTQAYEVDLESDGSTWTGDTGLTAFKISKAVTVDADCIACVRVYFAHFVGSAYVYIDPKIVVT